VLPSCLNKDKTLHDLELPETSSLSNVLKITGLADAVEGRVNVIVNNKQVFRDYFFSIFTLKLTHTRFLANIKWSLFH